MEYGQNKVGEDGGGGLWNWNDHILSIYSNMCMS